MARETINGISVPIPGTGEPPDFVGDLRQIAADLAASTEVTASRPIVLGKGNGRRGNALRFFHAALANAAVSPVNVLLIGDSNTEGSKASNTETRWLARLRDSLRAAYQPVGIPGGKGYFPMYYAGGQFPDPWTYTGGTGTNDDFGLGMRSKYLAGAGVTASLVAVATSFKVFYTKAFATGSFEVRIDGSLVATVNTGGFGTVETGVWTSSALTRGRHTLAITPTSATQVSIEGAMVFDGDENAGIRVWDGARSGATASQFLTDNAAWHTAIDEVNPHLVILGLGRNDWSGNTTPEQFKTNMRTLLDDKILAQAPNTSIAFLVAHQTVSGTATTDWADFVPALYELAEEYDAAVIDLNERFGPTVATAAPLALVDADEVHLTDKGSQLYADAVVQDVMPPRPPQRVVTNSLRPYLATVENFPRLGTAFADVDIMLSGRMILTAIHLDPCLVSKIGFVSGTRAAVTPTNQWAALYDRDLNRLAVSADDATTAWGASAVKTFGIASPYRVLSPGLYYIGLVVVAGTVPNFKGVPTYNSNPILAGSDTTNTGLTNPASAPSVATLVAQASHPYAFVA